MAGSTGRAGATSSELDLSTAERLLAENGAQAIADAGTRAELVRAIMRKHATQIDKLRARMVADATGSTELRDWVSCLVRPVIEYLDASGSPTWYARFCAQLTTDSALADIEIDASLDSPSLRSLLDNLERCLPELPPEVHGERAMMARYLILHTCVEREQALAEGAPTLWSSWDHAANSLIDGIVGLWQGPVGPQSSVGADPHQT